MLSCSDAELGASCVARPFESEPVTETSVLADIAWATGHRFDS